eukprot:PhM_4_TR4043/c0_g1_i1/m.54724/K07374/TUBA; tubulin alpha
MNSTTDSCIITIHVGSAGVGAAPALWNTYAREHNICHSSEEGKQQQQQHEDGTKKTSSALFRERPTATGEYVPRAILIDDDDVVLNRATQQRNHNFALFNADTYLFRQASGGVFVDSWAASRATIVRDTIVDTLVRRHLEAANSGSNVLFQFVHSVEGGIGSGLTCSLMEMMKQEHKKIPQHTLTLWPSGRTPCVVSPYNAVLSMPCLVDTADMVTLVDNTGAARVCAQYGYFDDEEDDSPPNYHNINEAYARVLAAQTAPHRLNGESLSSFATNITPFRRLHFFVPTLGGCSNNKQQDGPAWRRRRVGRADGMNLCLVRAFDLRGCSLLSSMQSAAVASPQHLLFGSVALYDVRGHSPVGVAGALMGRVLRPNRFAEGIRDFYPNTVKFDVIRRDACFTRSSPPHQEISSVAHVSSCLLHNVFEEVGHRFDLLYRNRAFVGTFLGCGMRSSEFSFAREDMEALTYDYRHFKAVAKEGVCEE